MKKISEMYRLSGGTDYRHTCSECFNCRKDKNIYRCRLYEEAGGKGPWKPYFIACKFFGMHHLPEYMRKQEDEDIPKDDGRQMDIFDFLQGEKI